MTSALSPKMPLLRASLRGAGTLLLVVFNQRSTEISIWESL